MRTVTRSFATGALVVALGAAAAATGVVSGANAAETGLRTAACYAHDKGENMRRLVAQGFVDDTNVYYSTYTVEEWQNGGYVAVTPVQRSTNSPFGSTLRAANDTGDADAYCETLSLLIEGGPDAGIEARYGQWLSS